MHPEGDMEGVFCVPEIGMGIRVCVFGGGRGGIS